MPTSKFRAEPNNGSDPGAVAAIRSSFIIVRNLDDVTVPAKLSSSSSVPPSEDVYLISFAFDKKTKFCKFRMFRKRSRFRDRRTKNIFDSKKISVVVTFSNHSFFWAGGGLARPGLDLWPPKEVISVRGRKYFRPKQKNKAAFINYVFSVERDSEGKYFISKIRSKTPESLFRCRRSFKFRNKHFFYQPRNSFDSKQRTVF